LKARSGPNSARELVLVTTHRHIEIVGKAGFGLLLRRPDRADPNASVALWKAITWGWVALGAGIGNKHRDGLAIFKLRSIENNRTLFASAAGNDRQAFSAGSFYANNSEAQPWRTMHSPIVCIQAERNCSMEVHSSSICERCLFHAGESGLNISINDPRGTKVSEGKSRSTFGSAWDRLELTGALPLGEYSIQFWTRGESMALAAQSSFVGRVQTARVQGFSENP